MNESDRLANQEAVTFFMPFGKCRLCGCHSPADMMQQLFSTHLLTSKLAGESTVNNSKSILVITNRGSGDAYVSPFRRTEAVGTPMCRRSDEPKQ